jgi:prepilin-type N-terminal cleavage/methylation domain-containing protein
MVQNWIRSNVSRLINWKCRETTKDNRGFSLIELLIAVAVLAVVSTMLMQILAAAAGLYRKTIVTSQLQKSSQMLSRRLETAIMNAKSLYYLENPDKGVFLYMGDTVPEQNETSFPGAYLWFDKETNAVYYCDQKMLTTSDGYQLTIADVKNALEGEDGTDKDYLLAVDVSELTFDLPASMNERRLTSEESSFAYTADPQPTITYHLKLQHISGITYTVSNSAVPRNHLKGIWWQK